MTHRLDQLVGPAWADTEFLFNEWTSAGDLVDELDDSLSAISTKASETAVLAVTGSHVALTALAALAVQSLGWDVVNIGTARRLPMLRDFASQRGGSVETPLRLVTRAGGGAEVQLHRLRGTSQHLPCGAGRLVFATSGSTGPPKFVGFTPTQVRFIVDAISESVAYGRSDVVASPLPVSFDYGFYQVALCLRAACRLITTNSMTLPRHIVDVASVHAATVLPVTPAFARAMIAASDRDSLPHVRLVTSTGAPFSASLQAKVRKLCLTARLLPMYGLTECKRVTVSTPDLARTKPDSVGLPLPGTVVRIVDAVGNDVPPGEPGEAIVSGPHVAHGYYGDTGDEGSLRRDSAGQWNLHTGDLMRRDDDGALFHLGRLCRDFVKILDERVSLVSVEECLRTVPGNP